MNGVRETMLRSGAGTLLLTVILALAACGDRPRDPGPLPAWHEADGHRWRELREPRGDGPGFEAMPAGAAGVDFTNSLPDSAAYRNRILAQGSGVAMADVNGDSRPDLYLASVHGRNALYLNRGGWRFREITDSAGVALPEHASTGVAFADVNGDRDPDLLVGGLGDRTRLLINDGDGHFTDATDGSGLEGERGTSTLTLADVDGDGDLDLYVTNYRRRMVWDVYPERSLAIDSITRRTAGGLEVIPELRDFCRLDTTAAGPACDWIGQRDELYLNDGSGHFRRVDWTSGRFRTASGEPLEEAPRDWGLTARFHDLDDDGDQDLYVCNDFRTPDRIWLNHGNGTFRAAPFRTVRSTSMSCMAVAFSDVDRDGDTDFYSSDMLAPEGPRRKTQQHTYDPEPVPPGSLRMRVQKNYNTLQLNRGDGTFAEVARARGAAASGWTWGTMFLDVDLDGYEDLLLANGHRWDQLDADTYASPEYARASWQTRLRAFPRLDLSNVALRNRGGREFRSAGEAWGFAVEPDVSHGIARADLDADGDQDVVVSRLNRPPLLYVNRTPARRLAVRPVSRPPATPKVGATVEVRGGPGGVQTDRIGAGGMYLSGSAPGLTFAAGDADSLTISVRWPDGRRRVIDGARPGRLYEVAPPSRTDSGAATAGGVEGETDAPLFSDATEQLGGHVHSEPPFDDFRRQPHLPLQLSRLGPGVTWADLGGDGDPDLVIGTGRGGRPTIFRNDGGRLNRVSLGMATVDYDLTALLPLPDGDGGTTLLAGQSNYEAEGPEEGSSVPSALRIDPAGLAERDTVAAEVSGAVAGAMSSAGPLAAADYDGDGDLDLFVGGRVRPTGYPVAASSRLFRSEPGGLVRDRRNAAVLEDVGLVSGAVFSDQDGDGDPDLLLATEWGPVRYLRNDGGQFTDVTAEMGLDTLTGRWNGVAAGDFDEDGRLDLVLTGWGTNTRYGPSDEPLHVYYGFFGGTSDRTLDVVEARRQEWTGGVAPLLGLAELRQGMERIDGRVESFHQYARSTVEEVVGSETLAGGRHRTARQLRHLLLLNRGDGYEVRPLPPEAQRAPSFHVAVADADGDGHEDLFLTQNFFGTRPGVGWYAAGRSLWLMGDGTGHFRSVGADATGVAVYGDPRGAAVADYDGDARVDLAVSQNGARTRLFHNEGARRGLRVRLIGPRGNPRAAGAAVRVMYRSGDPGPVREVHLGSGYWSVAGPVPVLGLEPDRTVRGIRIRWPDGDTAEVPVEPGQHEVTARAGG